MISICCASINSKYDTSLFVEALHRHNPNYEFEVIVAHDNRVRDGSAEHFKEMVVKYPNVKVIESGEEVVMNYLDQLLRYYDKNNIFPAEVRAGFRKNFERAQTGDLFDAMKTFLWITCGFFYNRAVAQAKGDILIVTPGDFFYLFQLEALEKLVRETSATLDGHYYAKPGAIWAGVSNQDVDFLRQYTEQIHLAGVSSTYRWETAEVFRDYLRYPCTLDDLYISDPRNNQLITLGQDGAIQKMETYACESFEKGGTQCIPFFHGFHVMTRKTYNTIGGFSEEFFGRAFADDKMSHHGRKYGIGKDVVQMEPKYSIAWCGQGEYLPERGPVPTENPIDRLHRIDPWWAMHPIPNRDKPCYLSEGLMQHADLSLLVNNIFKRDTAPVRF